MRPDDRISWRNIWIAILCGLILSLLTALAISQEPPLKSVVVLQETEPIRAAFANALRGLYSTRDYLHGALASPLAPGNERILTDREVLDMVDRLRWVSAKILAYEHIRDTVVAEQVLIFDSATTSAFHWVPNPLME